jgi:hypothetical protein
VNGVRLEHMMGLIIFAGSLLVMLSTVPWAEIKRFALFGLSGGLGVGAVLTLVMQNWLGLWVFRQVDLLYLDRIPLLLLAAWTPTEIFFAHFLSRYQHLWPRLLLILFIPAISVAVHFIQLWNGMLIYRHWNLLGTFLLSLAIHVSLAYYLHKAHHIPLME